MITTTGLAATHMECRNLQESLTVITELLAFEKIIRETRRSDAQAS